jgi:hypothetical protein
LPSDLQALEAYTGGQPKLGLTCEQEDAAFVDCAQFDFGRDSLNGAYQQWETAFDESAFRLAAAIATGANPEPAPTTAAILADPLKRIARHLAADAEYVALRSGYPKDLSPADESAYRDAVLAQQKAAFANLAGDLAPYVAALVTTGLTGEDAEALAGVLRARAEAVLSVMGGSIDPSVADAYFNAVTTGLAGELGPLNEATYACVGCP